MPNRLANETSPYLLQHADNPVDWYPWGEDAFEKARNEDKPILLSVGYSSCHWCHVMAHESFENEDTAALMNQWYVNVKLDREERPDVDGVYMTVVQAMTGSGGWPMTVFLTPNLEPFYAGTYFPPEDGHGRPGFRRVLEALHNAWENEREKVVGSATDIARQLREGSSRAPMGSGDFDSSLTEAAVNRFRDSFDAEWGGFGSAPKFPSPSNLEFLLAHHVRMDRTQSPDPGALYLVTETLRHMASGGMYDQLGGGFARYSVDVSWTVPHFEKMLYDNALLVRVYLHAWQITGNPEFSRIVRETLDYLQREMMHSSGGFYSAQDADSEGIEGKYFVWTLEQLREALGEDDFHFAAAVFGATRGGNFFDPHHPELTGRNVLTRRAHLKDIAPEFGMTETEADSKFDDIRARLLAIRSSRIPPGLDDKVLTSWNGLALAAFAEAARVLGDPGLRNAATRLASFLRDEMWKDGRLLHTWKNGDARIEGMLEDYAYAGLGLVELYKTTGDITWLEWARELLKVALAEFRDEANGAFFESPRSGEKLLFDQKSFFDAATPSGNGAVAQLAWWLGRYFETEAWESVTGEVVAQIEQQLHQVPSGFGATLTAVELALAPRQELVVVGSPEHRGPLEAEAALHYIPWLVLAPGEPGTALPLFEERDAGPAAQAFFCEDRVCQLPVADPAALARQLTGDDPPR